MVRRLAALFAAMSLSLLLVSPALANVPLHQEVPIDWNDAGSQGSEEECAGVVLEPGEVLWHFVLVQSDTNDETLTATFADDEFNVTNMPPTDRPDDMADHWVLHWDIVTTQTTLTSAFASGDSGILNLSHICPGSPPPEIPEAPASVLLVGTAGLGLLGFYLLRQRRREGVI
jgi:hypothetical protein